jgi:succinylglutamic semialdehyde dehydrogenase
MEEIPMNEASLFIDGHWQRGEGALVSSLNPASGKLVWQGDGASIAQVDQAVWAARKALPSWRRLSLEQRLAPLRAYQSLLEKHAEVLAEYIGEETGKPLWESRTEVATMTAKMAVSIDAYHERCRSFQKRVGGVEQVLQHRPLGVMAVLGPFNFPGHLPNGHIIPALLAGNTLVFKPSALTPRIGEQLVELWHQAGLPPGVLNLIQGDGRHVGKALAAHPQLDGLLFTGSAEVGLALQRQFAEMPGKMLALEMGGNNPLIVEPVTELRAAVHDTLMSAYISAGQRCTCARRLLVPDNGWGDDFLAQLSRAILAIRVGAYDEEPQPFMGAVISNQAALDLLHAQTELQKQGAEELVTMQHLAADTGLLRPGLIDVSGVDELADREYFGPLLQVIRYSDFDQALELANATHYGLSAGLISDDRQQFELFSDRIRAGIVNWNRPTTGAAGSMPFGGLGASGNLRPSAYYAADYCAYPVASMQAEQLQLPDRLAPGLSL